MITIRIRLLELLMLEYMRSPCWMEIMERGMQEFGFMPVQQQLHVLLYTALTQTFFIVLPLVQLLKGKSVFLQLKESSYKMNI